MVTMTMILPRQWLLLLLLLAITIQCSSFVLQQQHQQQRRRKTKISSSSTNGVQDAEFDFSSARGWDDFYKADDADILEWHSSVPLQTLIDAYIPVGSSCLVVGCGNSQLPRAIYDAHHHDGRTTTRVTCLDSSSTCLDQLKRQFEDVGDTDSISFVCGDAVELTTTLDTNGIDFDIIIDKGLTDALLCGEGWNGPLERLLQESIKVLKRRRRSSNTGTYLLVSYQLPRSTEEFIQEVTAPHLEWSFRRPEGNGRVQVSVATMTRATTAE